MSALRTTWKREGGLRARRQAGCPGVLPLQGSRTGQGSATRQGSDWHLRVQRGERVALFEWKGIHTLAMCCFGVCSPACFPRSRFLSAPGQRRCLVRPLGEALPGSYPQREHGQMLKPWTLVCDPALSLGQNRTFLDVSFPFVTWAQSSVSGRIVRGSDGLTQVNTEKVTWHLARTVMCPLSW